MSRKEIDFSDRFKAEVNYSQLGHDIDTRVEGSQDIDFVKNDLLHSFKDTDAALAEALKHPIEVTGDFQLVVGRNFALLLQILLDEEDPKIPVEVYRDIPSFAKLDVEDQLRIRAYAVSKDIVKDRRRGLNPKDLLFNVQDYVDKGISKEQAIEDLVAARLPAWRVPKLYSTAKGIWTQKQVAKGRKIVAGLREEKKPVNSTRICENLGIPTARTREIESPIRRGATTATVTSLKSKQKTTAKSKHYADHNFEWFTLSEQGTLSTSDFETTVPMSAGTFLEITQHHLSQAQTNLALWQGAMMRAQAQVARLTKKSSL